MACCYCGLVTQSCLLLTAPWTVAHQAPLSMGFPRQEYWSGLPFPSPGDRSSHPGIKPTSPESLALAGRFFTTEPPGKLWLWNTIREQATMLAAKSHPQETKGFNEIQGLKCWWKFIFISHYADLCWQNMGYHEIRMTLGYDHNAP